MVLEVVAYTWLEHPNSTEKGFTLNADAEATVLRKHIYVCLVPSGLKINVNTPQLCACFLWCLLSSSPGLACPALWGASQDSHTPPDTENNTHKHITSLETVCLYLRSMCQM